MNRAELSAQESHRMIVRCRSVGSLWWNTSTSPTHSEDNQMRKKKRERETKNTTAKRRYCDLSFLFSLCHHTSNCCRFKISAFFSRCTDPMDSDADPKLALSNAEVLLFSTASPPAALVTEMVKLRIYSS